MTRSIRKFLIFNLLLSLVIITGLAILGSMLLEHKDIQRHTDSELVKTSLLFQSLLNNNVNQANYPRMQEDITNIPENYKKLFHYITGYASPTYEEENFQFQVWDNQGHLLLHSKNAPAMPLSDGKDGFSNKSIKGKHWRVFTIYNHKTGMSIVVAISYTTRAKLEQRLSQDYIFIVLLTSPLLALLIWIIVGKGLNTIRRVATEVSQRAPTYLEPVDLQSVPLEIQPLVDELNRLFSRLKEAFEREKRFAADAAHELRTPLAALKTQAQIAMRAKDENERQHALQNLIAGVDRATHVMQQLLTLSRLVPEATMENSKNVNLANLAREVITLLIPCAMEKNIQIDLQAPEQISYVRGNTTALSVLIRNLVDNAIRYTPKGSEVHTIIEETRKQIILKVIDNGPGIPSELRARVFERFYRILGNQSPGSGLGLAIVQQIAGLHGAKVKLSQPSGGQGLEVRVVFKKQ